MPPGPGPQQRQGQGPEREPEREPGPERGRELTLRPGEQLVGLRGPAVQGQSPKERSPGEQPLPVRTRDPRLERPTTANRPEPTLPQE